MMSICTHQTPVTVQWQTAATRPSFHSDVTLTDHIVRALDMLVQYAWLIPAHHGWRVQPALFSKA